MKKLFILASITPMLVGCGITQPTLETLKAHEAMQTARIACYETEAVKANVAKISLAQIPREQQMMVVILQQQQDFTKQVLAMVTGKSTDPCGGTNLFDAQIAEVKARNRTASQITQGALSMVPWIVGGFALTAIADNSGGGSYNAGGDITYMSDNSNNMRQSFKTNNTSVGDYNNHSDDPVMTPIDLGDDSSNDDNVLPGTPIEE